MNIAKEFSIGNTKIRIATDFCEGKTEKDVEAILNNIQEIARPYLEEERK